MPAKPSRFVIRRHQLAMLAVVPLVGCTATVPVTRHVSESLQKPQRLTLLPTEPPGRIALDQLSSSRTFSGGSGGLTRMALWDGRRSSSNDFTRLLSENGLAASQYLTDQILVRSKANQVTLTRLSSQQAAESIINRLGFKSLALTADAVVDIEMIEVAYAAANASAFWPRIHASMAVISTRDDAKLVDRHYQIRFNAAPVAQRDIKPQTISRFLSVNEIMANPRLVIKMLHQELDAMARLMALDLEALTQEKA